MKAVWGRAALLVALTMAVYANSLENGFHYDDTHSIVNNPSLRHLNNIPVYFADPSTFSREKDMGMYRPLLQSTFALNYALGGYRPWGYRLGNMLLHGLAAAVLFLLLLRLSGRLDWSGWAALLWGVHPIHTQAVNYISSRSEIAAALGVLSALCLAYNYRRYAWAAAAYGAALLCKSAAVALLPLLVGAEWARGQARWWLRLWPFAALSALYGWLIYGNDFLPRSLAQQVRPWEVHLLSQVKATVYYLWLLAAPVHLSVEHNLQEVQGLADAALWAAFLLLVSLGYCSFKGRHRLAGQALWWGAAALALPFFWPLNVLVNEHRLYLAAIAPLLFLADATRAGAWGARLKPVAWIALGIMALLTWQRNPVWNNELSLWSDAAAKAPASFRAQSNAGLALLENGQSAAGLRVLEGAVRLNPDYAKTWNNLGLAYGENGQGEKAEIAYAKALELDPQLAGPLNNLARRRLRAGQLEEAAALLQRALDNDPYYAEAQINLGRVWQEKGNRDKALQAYTAAVALEPGWAAAHNNLGMAYIEAGRLVQGLAALERAVELEPGFVEARINLRLEQARQSDEDLQPVYSRLAESYPDRWELHAALGRIWAGRGQWSNAAAAYERAVAAGAVAVWPVLGEVYRRSGRNDDAIAAYSQAVALRPGDAASFNNLAAAYAAAGRLAPAVEAARRAVALAPDQERYRRNLTRLEQAGGTAP
jgi:protein O-mannosyl-transferase